MDNLHLHSGYARPLRPNVYDRESRPSVRVSSDPDSSSRRSHLHKHKSSHRHHHHHDEHRRHSSTRHHAKEVVQSALQPPTSFGDLLKQARGSKENSPSHSRSRSRRRSPARGESGEQQKTGEDVGLTIPPPRPLRPEEIEREAKRLIAIGSNTKYRDLRAALQSLSDQSLKTSRRLDDTYYSILEKVSTLRQTIGTLQELSGLTKELHGNFETDAQDLLNDVKGQFENSDNFDVQQKQVAVLEERIRVGKEKADALTARLTEVKEKVDRRARSEAQWEADTNRWWQWFGCIVISIISLVVILVVLHHLKPTHVEMNPEPTLDTAVEAKIREAPIPKMAKEDILELATSVPTIRLQTPSAKSSAEVDDVLLRKFDEL
ncbi:hypothetical protein BU25DRAFT_340639 [Macroventuria anomochaeta]|uniref:Uncharacterized protein n=1 Tax=Macroventuria anomochaeta TaxID=301207 RepID=A0ACB6S0J7_9PLEO|nr:uncharacterized protein BU25DRAFT_340639 [Macroventuria anomochaeta]KAF2627765.1 hypothetical protein BU25DRAFT_340639 [Macroventuria anomochaeta]